MLTARQLIMAVPAYVASELLSPLDTRLGALCGEIRYESTAAVVLAYPKSAVSHPVRGTGFVVPRVERSVSVTAGLVELVQMAPPGARQSAARPRIRRRRAPTGCVGRRRRHADRPGRRRLPTAPGHHDHTASPAGVSLAATQRAARGRTPRSAHGHRSPSRRATHAPPDRRRLPGCRHPRLCRARPHRRRRRRRFGADRRRPPVSTRIVRRPWPGIVTRRPVHLIGVPLDLGAGRRGVDMGPSAMRIAGLGERLAAIGYEVDDLGDLTTPNPETKRRGHERKKYAVEIGRVCQRLYQKTLDSLDAGALPVAIGGDHSLAAGSVAGAAAHARRRRKRVGLIWVDAHADMNTPDTSPSGNVHGMPLAALLGPEPSELSRIGAFTPKVRAVNTVIVGLRTSTLTSASGCGRRASRCSRCGTSTNTAWPRSPHGHSIWRGVDRGCPRLIRPRRLRPGDRPGRGTPVRGGLSYREAHTVMELIADSGRLTSLDMVELNPILDSRNVTAELGAELVSSALGLKDPLRSEPGRRAYFWIGLAPCARAETSILTMKGNDMHLRKLSARNSRVDPGRRRRLWRRWG